MSYTAPDFMDAVLQAAADYGAEFHPPAEETGEWSSDTVRASASHVAGLLRQRAELRQALHDVMHDIDHGNGAQAFTDRRDRARRVLAETATD
jgi:hypothetical protein